MHAFLFVSQSAKDRQDAINRELGKYGIHTFDQVRPVTDTPTVGISDIRTFIKRVALNPQYSTHTAGIIEHGERLSTEAQQALLKTLEEPPSKCLLFIGTTNTSTMLPTIISRCMAMPCSRETAIFSDEQLTHVSETLRSIRTGSVGSLIQTVSTIGSSKGDIFTWIDMAICALRRLNPLSASDIALLHALLGTKKYQANNVSPVLLLEHALMAPAIG